MLLWTKTAIQRIGGEDWILPIQIKFVTLYFESGGDCRYATTSDFRKTVYNASRG